MSALRGLSDVNLPTAISFASYWLIAMPTCYVLGFKSGLGARGIWWGLATGLAVAAMALTRRFLIKTRPESVPAILATSEAVPVGSHAAL